MSKGRWKLWFWIIALIAIGIFLASQFLSDYEAAPKETALIAAAMIVLWVLDRSLERIYEVLQEIRDILRERRN